MTSFSSRGSASVYFCCRIRSETFCSISATVSPDCACAAVCDDGRRQDRSASSAAAARACAREGPKGRVRGMGVYSSESLGAAGRDGGRAILQHAAPSVAFERPVFAGVAVGAFEVGEVAEVNGVLEGTVVFVA